MEGHILITGGVGAGKSTLAQTLLRRLGRPVYGFLTVRFPPSGADGSPVFLFPAALPPELRVCGAENRVGICGGAVRRAYPEVFETLGVSLLRAAKPDGVILMDELGFLEADAPRFQAAVLEALHGTVPVLACIKDRPGVPFLEQVRACPGTVLYTVTPGNRAALPDRILR